jgi:hypothetical protein
MAAHFDRHPQLGAHAVAAGDQQGLLHPRRHGKKPSKSADSADYAWDCRGGPQLREPGFGLRGALAIDSGISISDSF